MEKGIEDKKRCEIAERVSITTLTVNVVLSVIKVFAGIFAKSNAMLADGVHTISDVVTTLAVMIGMRFSTMPEDENHPYGHEKIESVVAKLLSIVLMGTALGIGYSGLKTILEGNYSRPGTLALWAAAVSILAKECMYRYTIHAADQINSAALKADAWHHRSDAYSSIGTLVGIGGARLGIAILDPIASLVVCAMILKVAVEIFIQSFNQLIDRSASPEKVKQIRTLIEGIDGVKGIDEVKTRMHGCKIYVDVEISVDSTKTVGEGHTVAETVHHSIENNMEEVKHCMVHVNPFGIKTVF